MKGKKASYNYTDFLLEIARERAEKFSRWKKYVSEIKRFVRKRLGGDIEVIVFGSVARGDYTVGLSDIDVLVVSRKFKNRDVKYEILGELLLKYGGTFEFHLVTPKEKKLYLKFIKRDMVKL